MGQIQEIGFFFWLGAAATTTAIMAVFAAASFVKRGKLPEQDIPYWQGLLIYLTIEAIPAAVFALTALISSSAGVFPLIGVTGSGLVSLIVAGAIQVVVAGITLSGDANNPRQKEQRQLSNLEKAYDFIRQVEILERFGNNSQEMKKQQLTVQELRPGYTSRWAISIPLLVFLVLPIVLYCCVQFLSVST